MCGGGGVGFGRVEKGEGEGMGVGCYRVLMKYSQNEMCGTVQSLVSSELCREAARGIAQQPWDVPSTQAV